MILVITINNDPITINICMWLLHFKKRFRIFSSEDVARIIKVTNESMVIKNVTRDYLIDLKEVNKVLYRQGDVLLSSDFNADNDNHLSEFLMRENVTLRQLFYHRIKKINHLGHPQIADLNKFVTLEEANQCDLLIPDYIFTSKKSELTSFLIQHDSVITKTILPAYYYDKEGSRYASFTERLELEDLNALSDDFHPTFFQKMIPKKFDIRVFYLENNFYSIAVISQNNESTKIDARHYDRELPNRQIPFKLPEDIENKLRNLIAKFKLRYCSIDFIYGSDKQIYFLEINPIGQFGNVSYFGNYYLEKKMAETLCA